MKQDYEISTDPLRTGFKNLRVALALTGSAHLVAGMKERLKADRIDILMIQDPCEEDCRHFLREDGHYYFGPLWLTWHKAAVSYVQSLRERTNLSPRRKNRKEANYWRKLAKSSAFQFTWSELTEESWNDWYRLYELHVVQGLQQGARMIGPDFQELDRVNREWKCGRMLNENGQPVAGIILELFPNKSICKIKCLASSRTGEHAASCLGIRMVHEVTEFAMKQGFRTLSYGSDPNFYGELASIGLHHFKASLGFVPFHWKETYKTTRLIRICRPLSAPWLTYAFRNWSDRSLEIRTAGLFPHDHCFPDGIPAQAHAE